MGTLQLNAGNVLSTIKSVNEALQGLGKGVDLDVLKALGLGSSSGSGGGGGGTRSGGAIRTNVNELQKATRLYTDMLNIQTKMTSAGTNQLNILKQQYETRQKEYRQISETTRQQAQQSTQAQKA